METSAAESERGQERLTQAEETLARARADRDRLAAAAQEAERTLAGHREAEQDAQRELDRAAASSPSSRTILKKSCARTL